MVCRTHTATTHQTLLLRVLFHPDASAPNKGSKKGVNKNANTKVKVRMLLPGPCPLTLPASPPHLPPPLLHLYLLLLVAHLLPSARIHAAATAIGSAAALDMDDIIYAQYRETGVLLYRGYTLQNAMDQCFSNKDDIGGGKQVRWQRQDAWARDEDNEEEGGRAEIEGTREESVLGERI